MVIDTAISAVITAFLGVTLEQEIIAGVAIFALLWCGKKLGIIGANGSK